MSNTDNVIMAGSVGGVALVGTGLSTDTVQNSYYVKKIKDAGSKFSIDVASKFKASKVGKAGAKASTYVKGVGEAAAATKAGSAVMKGVKAAAPLASAAGAAVGPAVDIAMGAVTIADHSQQANVSDGKKAYNITGDVVGMAVNVGLNFVAGPAAIVIMFFQVLGGLLDAAWDPFKNYFNSDLETMRLSIIDSLKVAYREVNMNYPIETKPDILSSLNNPESEDSKEYIKIMKTYLEDRGFISSEDVIAEEEYFLSLKSIKRQRKLYRINENGELEMKDPDMAAVALFDSATNNDLIMMALAAKYARSKGVKVKGDEKIVDISQSNGKGTNITNYIIGAFVISSLFLIFFFSIIFIASI
jgi:hypothetical protein